MKTENAILDALVEKGAITRDQIMEIAIEGIDDVMNGCAMLMHSLFCKAKFHEHQPEMVDPTPSNDICNWYAEQTLGTCWQEPDHKTWLNRCDKEMKRQDFQFAKELHDFLLIVTKAAAEIHFLKQKYVYAGELLKELL